MHVKTRFCLGTTESYYIAQKGNDDRKKITNKGQAMATNEFATPF